MPSTPVRPLSHHLVINTHNLSQAHNRGSPRSANANSAVSFKDSNRPSMEKRHSFGPGGGLGSSGLSSPFHAHGHTRSRQSLSLALLRILACAPGFFGLIYSLSIAWDNRRFEQEQQQHQYRTESYQGDPNINDDGTLTRSDFWIASMWCALSMFWAYLLTTAVIQRLLQSYRPPNVVLRVALAHLLSWVVTGTIVTSRPFTEPIRPWVFISLAQGLLVFAIVYLPWFKTQQAQTGGSPKLSERIANHVLEDGFMGREISRHSATRFLLLPLVIVALCSWMLIITRSGHGYAQDPSVGGGAGIIQDTQQPSTGSSLINNSDSYLNDIDRQKDTRMVISMIVLSSATPQGYVNRKMFRETTLKLFPSPRNKAVVVKYRFILGTSLPEVERELEQEHRTTGDLLIVSTPDRADSKSRKLYKAIEWANQFDFDYLIKTEDDVLVRMDTLSGELYKQGKKEYFWKGLVFKNVPNTRLDDLDLKEMPMFTDGTLFTLSRDIVHLLSIPAPRYFVASSAQSLGIWLHGYGIKPIHDTRIQPGAFVCEEDLIAKHFDNEPSLLIHPREDPVKMIERINIIRAELKKNKGNRNFRTNVSICDKQFQKRCAMCYSCQGRASNWKLMGFDCKQGGVIVGDKYRKPDLLDAKQMDELLNRPSGGVLEELGPVYLKDYRPESRARQSLNRDQQVDEDEDPEEDNSEETEEEVEEEVEGVAEGDNEDGTETQEEQEDEGAEDEGAEDEESDNTEDPDQEEETEEQDGTDPEHHDESDMPISDQEVDYLEQRHGEEALPLSFKAVPAPQKTKKKPKH